MPLFIGFVTAGVLLGVTFSFLVAASIGAVGVGILFVGYLFNLLF